MALPRRLLVSGQRPCDGKFARHKFSIWIKASVCQCRVSVCVTLFLLGVSPYVVRYKRQAIVGCQTCRQPCALFFFAIGRSTCWLRLNVPQELYSKRIATKNNLKPDDCVITVMVFLCLSNVVCSWQHSLRTLPRKRPWELLDKVRQNTAVTVYCCTHFVWAKQYLFSFSFTHVLNIFVWCLLLCDWLYLNSNKYIKIKKKKMLSPNLSCSVSVRCH